MKLSCLTRYDDRGASSRIRFEQFRLPLARLVPHLNWSRQSLLDARYLRHKYTGQPTGLDTLRCYFRRALELARQPAPDLRWVEKELWPYAPAWLERAVLAQRPYVLDLDDAIFHNYDLHPLAPVRWAWGRKIDRLMRGAALVTAGNAYLARRAVEAGARNVEIVPTVIDLDHYPPRTPALPSNAPIDIAWIGSPATVAYLQALAEPLQLLAARHPVRLVVIGADAPSFPGVEMVSKPWSADTEAADVASCHIGVMPLPDSPWERGKCGYKLVQCMAAGRPVIASPVGVNAKIVADGVDGFLAVSPEDWRRRIAELAADPGRRAEMGRAARAKAEREYSVDAVAPRMAQLLRDAAQA